MIPYVYRKSVYPYELAKSLDEMLTISNYPTKSDFYNTLTNEPISDLDYTFGATVWRELTVLCEQKNEKNVS